MSSIPTPSGPFVLVIFGATGDLSKKKLFPALFSLYKKKQFGEQFYIVGFSRREWGDDEFRAFLDDNISPFSDLTRHSGEDQNPLFGQLDSWTKARTGSGQARMTGSTSNDKSWQTFLSHVYYQSGTFADEKGYIELTEKLNTFDKEVGACITRVFYLATPPDHYLDILHHLDGTKLSEGCGQGSSKWTRVAIEKPFGKDLETAKMLDARLATIFEEKQIFRVDHYLGKETVQNMIAFRFANSMFETIWNKEYIDHIQITWMEESGIGNRGNFFDGVGMLRDVAQNHLLQLLSAVAMEQPRSFEKEAIRDVRAQVIKAIQPIPFENILEQVVRAQYSSYLTEKNVQPNSPTETYVAMKLFVDSPRFIGVPFYLRAGKKMKKLEVTISVVFKQTCHILFKEYGCPEVGNVLQFRIQPDEGITLQVIAKTPGNQLSLQTIPMRFSYREDLHHTVADAYEKILLDILSGDQMLFNRSDELASSWRFITDILQSWKKADVPVYVYDDGSDGPKEADNLIEKDGRKWL